MKNAFFIEFLSFALPPISSKKRGKTGCVENDGKEEASVPQILGNLTRPRIFSSFKCLEGTTDLYEFVSHYFISPPSYDVVGTANLPFNGNEVNYFRRVWTLRQMNIACAAILQEGISNRAVCFVVN